MIYIWTFESKFCWPNDTKLFCRWCHRDVYLEWLSYSCQGNICIPNDASGCSNKDVGCMDFYNRGNRRDMQSRVRGPSINLTGLRGCQSAWAHVLKHASQRACVSLGPHCQGSSEQHQNTRVSGSGRTAGPCPSTRLCLEPQLGVFLSRLWSIWPRKKKKEGGWGVWLLGGWVG